MERRYRKVLVWSWYKILARYFGFIFMIELAYVLLLQFGIYVVSSKKYPKIYIYRSGH